MLVFLKVLTISAKNVKE